VVNFFISAAHKSSGKTSISIGLCAALRADGLSVQPFKKGPDYIDPLWLGLASGRPCYNLDFYTMSVAEVQMQYQLHAQACDVAIIEGNKGLYDGLDLNGSNSNAALAKQLKMPVILVLDARGMTRGIAPLILGYQAFDPEIQIVGVILNKLGGARHESKLRAVIEHYTDIDVLGAVHYDPKIEIDERHLGLIPSNEHALSSAMIAQLATAVRSQVDCERIKSLCAHTHGAPVSLHVSTPQYQHLSVAIPRDAAFGFYYPGDLEAFHAAGVTIRYFDALHDAHLPAVDCLFVGGGFPETQMAALSANVSLRQDIARQIQQGLPTYAECGGLMYLSKKVVWAEQTQAMVGVIPGTTVMCEKPQGRGYVALKESEAFPWPSDGPGGVVYAHEFHYSKLCLDEPVEYAYEVLRGSGIDGTHDGLMVHNVLASYTHLRQVEQNPWVDRFLRFVDQHVKC